MVKRVGRFILSGDTERGYRFRLKASNGRVLLVSEIHRDRRACLDAIASAIEHGSNPSNFVKMVARNGKCRYLLKSSNNQVIGRSQVFSSVHWLQSGIATVVRNVRTTSIDDHT